MERCEICGKNAHLLRECLLCQRNVCPSCIRSSVGVCIECMPGKTK